MIEVVELQTEAELRSAYPVLRELRPALDETRCLERLTCMLDRGYRLFGACDEGEIVALVGLEVRIDLYLGWHVWVYNLVTSGAKRSRGYGKLLMDYVEEFARREHCECIALAAGLERQETHRFYEERVGMDRPGYFYCKQVG